MPTWTAPPQPQTLDAFLDQQLPHLGRLNIRKALGLKKCLVNGIPRHKGYKLTGGETIEWLGPTTGPGEILPERRSLEILHNDDHLLVVVKPDGLLVHPTHRQRSGTLLNALLTLTLEPRFPHRLDRETSGLMIITKTPRALNLLAKQFQKREVEKTYTALLAGIIATGELTIDAPIGRDPAQRPQHRVLPAGRPAQSTLGVLARRTGQTLVELTPVTGRTNQLRIHCAHVGHPIVGDTLYGGPAAERLYLHASRLTFRHPESNEILTFHSNLTI